MQTLKQSIKFLEFPNIRFRKVSTHMVTLNFLLNKVVHCLCLQKIAIVAYWNDIIDHLHITPKWKTRMNTYIWKSSIAPKSTSDMMQYHITLTEYTCRETRAQVAVREMKWRWLITTQVAQNTIYNENNDGITYIYTYIYI